MVKSAYLALTIALLLQPAVSAATRTSSVLANESRLSKPVSFQARRIHLGELLDRIGEATGTRLTADDRLEPVSGFELTLLVRKRPARELLEALPRLYSFPPDRWYWTREKEDQYLLRHTQTRAALQATRREYAKEFLVHAWRRHAEFFAHPEKQAALAAADPELRTIADPRFFARQRGFFSFMEGLQEADVRQILNGRRLDFPMDRLSPQQRDFVREEYVRHKVPGNPDAVPLEQLEKVTLYSSPGADGTICLDLGPSVGAYGVLGGSWLQQAQDAWRLRTWQGAGEDRTAGNLEIPARGEVVAPQQLQLSGIPLDEALLRLGKLGRIDLLFDRSAGEARADFGLGGPLQEVLANLGRTYLDWKHWAPFYLFRHQAWDTTPTEKFVPWPVVRDLRKSAEENHGYLRAEDWSRLAALNKEQLSYLEKEFPDTRSVAGVQILLRLHATMNDQERLAAARPKGAGWEDFTPATRQRLAVLYTPQDARASRIIVRWSAEGKVHPVQLFLGSGELRPREFAFQRTRRWDDQKGQFVDLPEEPRTK